MFSEESLNAIVTPEKTLPENPPEIPPPEPVQAQPAKKVKTQEQIDRHRRNSQAWHDKWVKKGVPKNGHNSEPAEPRNAEPANVESDFGFTVNLEGSLSEARNEFVAKWIAASTLPPSNERRTKALESWMASSFRAEMMASREGVQK